MMSAERLRLLADYRQLQRRWRRRMLRQCHPTGDEQAALRRLRRENRRQREKRDMLAYSTELRAELGVEDLCLGGCELLVGEDSRLVQLT